LAGLSDLGPAGFRRLHVSRLIRRTGMNYVAIQAAVWIAAGFVLVMLVIRRRQRRQHRQN
jgi:hypothetical protein